MAISLTLASSWEDTAAIINIKTLQALGIHFSQHMGSGILA